MNTEPERYEGLGCLVVFVVLIVCCTAYQIARLFVPPPAVTQKEKP